MKYKILKCRYCKSYVFKKDALFFNYNRCSLSPSKLELDTGYPFCSLECYKKDNKLNYSFWAELDKNPSDSECFEHTGWKEVDKKDKYSYLYKDRIGKCKITGKKISVLPLHHYANYDCYLDKEYKIRNPKIEIKENDLNIAKCVCHFQLRKEYRDSIEEFEKRVEKIKNHNIWQKICYNIKRLKPLLKIWK